MGNKYLLAILIFFTLSAFSSAQTESFTIKKALFSSDKYDEFCPVYYKNGIVFCTNRSKNSLSDYSGSNNKGQYKIFYIDTTSKINWNKSRLFSKYLTTRLNDGPATFTSLRDTIYFSRNIRTEGKLSKLEGGGNNLGVFFAVFDGKKWGKISEFRFNNDLYNVTTPYLSPDGSKLFFASDRPGGFGGSDIYYSQWKNGYWDDPVNLGPLINTKGNESYPFMNEVGELFFSSDGIPGLGGKDIFVTKQSATGWYPPVHLDPPVNSKYNDFGIVTDPLINEGYFSSDRGNSIDIFHFKANFFQFWFSEPQKENQYCFSISDTGSIQVDTLKLKYVWDFGDSSKTTGTNVSHCFPKPGRYSINLDLADRTTGSLFFRKLTYDIDIVDIDQPYIASPDFVIANNIIELDALKSFCPGYTIKGYFWDFGDSTKGIGARTSHKYSEKGEVEVKLGITLVSQNNGTILKRVVSKKINVFQDEREKMAYLSSNQIQVDDFNDIQQFVNVKVNKHYSAETDFKKEAVFRVELFSSLVKTDLSNVFFRNLPRKYSVKEAYDPGTQLYSYVIDQQMSLMATYPAYSEMIATGYKDTQVKLYVLSDPAEKQLFNIKYKYGLLSDSYFDYTNRLVTNAYLMLNQIIELMKKYPNINIEIAVYTDDQGVPANNLSLSQVRAQMMVDYLIKTGIDSKRLKAKGYGSTRPVAPNNYPTNKRLNRRVDFHNIQLTNIPEYTTLGIVLVEFVRIDD